MGRILADGQGAKGGIIGMVVIKCNACQACTIFTGVKSDVFAFKSSEFLIHLLLDCLPHFTAIPRYHATVRLLLSFLEKTN
jgi:hypothetical protein